MKNKSNVKVTAAAIALAMFLTVFFTYATTSAKNGGLVLRGKTDKSAYVLGEPVTIQFKFVNESEQPQMITNGGFEVGSLKLYVSKDNDQNYKEYFGPGWGVLRGQRKILQPGESHSYGAATLLWNGTPQVSHLNRETSERILASKINTQYLFPEPGVYYLKGVSFTGENFDRIESQPVKIDIKGPTGDDLEVWNQIKGNREIALLMQEGAFDTEEVEKKQQLLENVERLIAEHPNSIYANNLRLNLEKFKANEVRLQEMMRRAIQKPVN